MAHHTEKETDGTACSWLDRTVLLLELPDPLCLVGRDGEAAGLPAPVSETYGELGM